MGDITMGGITIEEGERKSVSEMGREIYFKDYSYTSRLFYVQHASHLEKKKKKHGSGSTSFQYNHSGDPTRLFVPRTGHTRQEGDSTRQ
jgi:hypothetical protein